MTFANITKLAEHDHRYGTPCQHCGLHLDEEDCGIATHEVDVDFFDMRRDVTIVICDECLAAV